MPSSCFAVLLFRTRCTSAIERAIRRAYPLTTDLNIAPPLLALLDRNMLPLILQGMRPFTMCLSKSKCEGNDPQSKDNNFHTRSWDLPGGACGLSQCTPATGGREVFTLSRESISHLCASGLSYLIVIAS